jgi:outer membrane protein OmpA-like peptidoglycan-associated protein
MPNKKMNVKAIQIFGVFILLMLFSLGGRAQDECDLPEVGKKAQKLYKKALDELKLGRYQSATKMLQEATDEEPDYIKAWWVMGDVNSRFTNRMRKTSIAIQAYEEVVRICPAYEDYYAYYYLGGFYMSTKKYDKAAKSFEAFLGAENDQIAEKHFDDATKQLEWARFYHAIFSNEVPFDPKKVDAISSPNWDEYLASITLDNDYLYFTRRMESKQVSGFTREDNRVERFCVAKRKNGLVFSQGEILPKPFNQQPNEGGPTLTIDNSTMYYTRCKSLPNRYFNCDIVEMNYTGGEWVEIGPLGPEINTPDSWESQPSISSDGNTLYFVSDRKGGQGGYDIYMARKDANGNWQQAVNMGPAINSPGHEKSPFIHTDSQTLYYSSSAYRDQDRNYFPGKKGLGGYDIFYTRLDGKNSWIEPKNIGYPINTEGDDVGFFVSTDGKYGYFASNRLNENRNWDLYYFELYKEARPQKVLFLKGEMKDEETGEVLRDSKIEIKNMKTKEVKEIPVNAETGKYAIAMTFKADYVVTVKKRDYVYVSKYISQSSPSYSQPTKIDFKLQRIQVGKSYNLDDIYYATDSDVLTANSIQILESFYEFLSENPRVKIEIQGHTDNVGSPAYNKALSERRAKTVYDYLVAKGISSSRLTYKGYGESKPVATNNTEAGRQKNRRTVFIITSK